MEEQLIMAPPGREWDHVNKRIFEEKEETIEVTFTSRASMHQLFLMPEMVDYLLSFLEEDPIDALFFCEFLTTSIKTRAVVQAGGRLMCIDYYSTPSYVNWLQRVASFRDYKSINKGKVKTIKAPTYRGDYDGLFNLTRVDPKATFYENRCDLLGIPCYFRLFSEHWINLWKKNKPVPNESDAMGWRNLKERGVDYFFFRFGETLGIYNLNFAVGPNQIDTAMHIKKPKKEIRGWYCVDCLTLLDMDEVAYGNGTDLSINVPRDVTDVVDKYRKMNPTVRLYDGGFAAAIPSDHDYIEACTGNHLRYPHKPKVHTDGKLRNVVRRCMTCINRRWKLIDMYDAWGLIEENFRDAKEWQIEIPNELLVRRMMPDCSVNMRSDRGTGEVGMPREEHIGLNGVSKYICTVTGRFLGFPKKYGTTDESALTMAGSHFSCFSRADSRRFCFIMRLLTLLPVRNFYVPHPFFAARLGFETYKEIDNQTRPAHFNPFPLDITVNHSPGSTYDAIKRRGRYYAAGKHLYYASVSRGHSVTYFHEEDVRWIIKTAKEFIERKKPYDICYRDWWESWMEAVLSNFFPTEAMRIYPGKSLLYILDTCPNSVLLQGGFMVPSKDSPGKAFNSFKYLGWLGCSGSMNPDLAFWKEYNPEIKELPLKAVTEEESHYMVVSGLIRTELRSRLRTPDIYVNEKEAEGNKEFERHLKFYEIYTGRRECGGLQKKIAKMLAKPVPEGKNIEILSLHDALKRRLCSWISQHKSVLPELNSMKKDTTLSFQRFLKANEAKIDAMSLTSAHGRKSKVYPNSLWKAQLTRIDYFAFQVDILIDWDKVVYHKIPWADVKEVYSEILRKTKAHNLMLVKKLEEKKNRKRKLREEKKELKRELKKIKRCTLENEKKETETADFEELYDYMKKNPALCLLLGATKEKDEEEEEEEEGDDNVLNE